MFFSSESLSIPPAPNSKSMYPWLTHTWNSYYFLQDESFQSVIYIKVVPLFFCTKPVGKILFSIKYCSVYPSSPSRHHGLKHTTWSSLFNCLISLHSTTDRLFIFIFSMNKSFNYLPDTFFSSTDGNTIFLPIWNRKLQDAVSVSKVPKCSLLPQSWPSHRNLAISLFIPPPSLWNSPLRIAQ